MKRLLFALMLCACSVAERAEVAQEQSLTCLPRCAARNDGGATCCSGSAYADVPADGKYILTTFGGGTDTGPMSCFPNPIADGGWWYAADRQRFGCGAVLRVSAANGRCAQVLVADYGPGTCVEDAACGPILDASPLVSRQLFGVSAAGWSEHRAITVQVLPRDSALGPCSILPDGGVEVADGGLPQPFPPQSHGGCGGVGASLWPMLLAFALPFSLRRAR